MLIHEGWYYDEALTKPVNIGDEILDDIDIYAKWVEGTGGTAMTADSSGATVRLEKIGAPNDITLEYSIDNETWENYVVGTTINLAPGEYVAFRGDNATFSLRPEDSYHFAIEGEIHLSGNIMSLVDKTGSKRAIDTDSQFVRLFDSNTIASIAPGFLPATKLDVFCYDSMFYNCTFSDKFTGFPDNFLPALDINDARGCYIGMFKETKGLYDLPSNFLPATNPGVYCYEEMFRGSSVKTIPKDFMLADSIADSACWRMFRESDVTTIDPNFCSPIELGDSALCEMFEGCTNLTYVGAGAFFNIEGCRSQAMKEMFAQCSNLTSVHSDFIKFKDINAIIKYEPSFSNVFASMFQGTKLVMPPTFYVNTHDRSCDAMFYDVGIMTVRIDPRVTIWGGNFDWLYSEKIDAGGNFYCPEHLVTSGQLYRDYRSIPPNWAVRYI